MSEATPVPEQVDDFDLDLEKTVVPKDDSTASPEKTEPEQPQQEAGLFEEAPESLQPSFGVKNFLKLLVGKKRTPGNGTCEFCAVPAEGFDGDPIDFKFQDGLPGEVGVNGLSNEVVIWAVINRLRAFEKGEFANEYNREAIRHLVAASSALARRTRDRTDRKVEGTLEK